MNVDNVVVTAEADVKYNCLAWTLGITTYWVWPWTTTDVSKADFDALYKQHGFNPAAAGEIAAFGNGSTKMKHGSISGQGHGPRWESKAGEWLRFQHGLGEMEGGTEYGDVVGFYTKAAGRAQPFAADVAIKMKLEKTELDAIAAGAARVPQEIRGQFEAMYAAWRQTWAHPLVAVSSNPADRARSLQFLELVSMGPAILPLLMERLASTDEFFALQAVDVLLPRSRIVAFELDDPRILRGEQERAMASVKRWLTLEG